MTGWHDICRKFLSRSDPGSSVPPTAMTVVTVWWTVLSPLHGAALRAAVRGRFNTILNISVIAVITVTGPGVAGMQA